MQWGLTDFLQLLGALGLFIYGMKLMSDGLQKAAGHGLRRMLKGMTKNRFSGILTGILATTAVQSSSATTVMVVSFVNAGLLTLAGSMAVIMGANIGTTVTAWLVAYFGFKVKITPIAIMMIGVAFPFLFSKRNKLKHIAEFILGFGILFIGLSYLKDAVPDVKGNPEMLSFLQSYTDMGYLSVLLFLVIGTILTLVVQSSSAAMAITLTLLSQGWIPYEMACAMVLGENIGTTVTANIAAAVGNIHAKRAAVFHTIFNLAGVIWMLIVFFFFTKFIYNSMDGIFEFFSSNVGEGSYKKNSVLKDRDLMSLALFHTTFNILNTLLLLWFLPFFERTVMNLVKGTKDEDEEFSLKHIGGGLLATPEISIEEARKETRVFGELVQGMMANTQLLLFDKPKDEGKLLRRIAQKEDKTDRLEIAILEFLAKVGSEEISEGASNRIQSLISIANDLERIGDIFYQLSKQKEKINDLNIVMAEGIKTEVVNFYNVVTEALLKMNKNLNLGYGELDISGSKLDESNINSTRDRLQKMIFSQAEQGKIQTQEMAVYLNLVNSAEKIGDHVHNVNEALAGIK